MRSGYCYGKRIMYTAEAYFANVHEDLYDSNMALWKVVNIGLRPREDKLHPGMGAAVLRRRDHRAVLEYPGPARQPRLYRGRKWRRPVGRPLLAAV